jgi:hypothetical protein
MFIPYWMCIAVLVLGIGTTFFWMLSSVQLRHCKKEYEYQVSQVQGLTGILKQWEDMAVRKMIYGGPFSKAWVVVPKNCEMVELIVQNDSRQKISAVYACDAGGTLKFLNTCIASPEDDT